MSAIARALQQGRALQHLSARHEFRQLPTQPSDSRWLRSALQRKLPCKQMNLIGVGTRPKSTVAHSTGEPNQIEPPDVADLAVRARLEVSPEEIEDWTPKIGKIIDWFGQLQEVDVEGVPPALRAGGDRKGNTVQADEPRAFEKRDALWDAVPSKEGPFIRVPKILNESTE